MLIEAEAGVAEMTSSNLVRLGRHKSMRVELVVVVGRRVRNLVVPALGSFASLNKQCRKLQEEAKSD